MPLSNSYIKIYVQNKYSDLYKRYFVVAYKWVILVAQKEVKYNIQKEKGAKQEHIYAVLR